MNFPEAVQFNGISLSVGIILDEGAFDNFCEPNQMWPSPFNRIIFVPQLGPLTLIVRDPVPPYFRTEISLLYTGSLSPTLTLTLGLQIVSHLMRGQW